MRATTVRTAPAACAVLLVAMAFALMPSVAAAGEEVFAPERDERVSYIVPEGVFYMTMIARGAGGEQGDSDTGRPGRGAITEGTFKVTPGEVLLVYTATGNGWGYAEGGDRGRVGGAASDGAGGGGASAILDGNDENAYMIAGGGGGAGGDDGGESEGGAGGDAGAP